MRRVLFLYLLLGVCFLSPFGRAQATQEEIPDSLVFLQTDTSQDSVSRYRPEVSLVLTPRLDRPNIFIDSLKKLIIVDGPQDMGRWMRFMDSLALSKVEALDADSALAQVQKSTGQLKTFREVWVVCVIGFLFLFIGILRYLFPNDLALLITAYYHDMTLGQVSKEDNLLISWPSIFIFVLSGLSSGLFIYLALQSGSWGHFPYTGFDDFLLMSVIIMCLFGVKVLCVRLIGWLFEIQKMVRQYVVVLYLSYYNAGLLVVPATLALAFLPFGHASWLVPLVLFVVVFMLVFRLIKLLAELLYNYRFSKFYLFVYLCTLEIAPILILLKILFR